MGVIFKGSFRSIRKRIVFWGTVLVLLSLNGRINAELKVADGGYPSPFFQADYIQNLSDFSSGIVNPALLYRVNQMRFEIGIYRWDFDVKAGGADDLGYKQLSFLYPVRRNQTIGATLIGNSAGLQRRESLSDVAENIHFGETWAVIHYSARILPWFMVGANPKFVRQNQFDRETRYGFGLDVGVYFNPLDHYRYGDIGLSLAFQDIWPAKLKWETNDGTSSLDYYMKPRIRGGLRYAFLNDKIITTFEVVTDEALTKLYDNMFNMLDSSEYSPGEGGTSAQDLYDSLKLSWKFSAHFSVEFIPQLWLKGGWYNNDVPYLGLAFNLIYPLPEMINYARVDVNVGYSVNEPERGLSLMTKLASDFGYTREQKESKRLYDLLILAPMNAYNEAMKLYMAGKYWEAGFAFGKVLSLFPNFHLNDKATYYLGNCYRFLRMNDISRDVYKEGLEEFTTSEMRAKFLYGIEALDYREGKYKSALKNHAFIINLYPESDVRPDADYLAGQVHFDQKNYNAAERLLSSIRPDAASYMYAQYTLAVINIVNGKTGVAMENLHAVLADTTANPGELLLQDAASVKLGQLYFEEVELRKAVEAFNRVPEAGIHGDEALLGMVWSWIKANRPQEAVQFVDKLIMMHDKSALLPEAYLVKGYALMLLKNYDRAIKALNECLVLCNTDFADNEDLAVGKSKFRQKKTVFSSVAEDIKKNTLRKPTQHTLSERSDLKSKYNDYNESQQRFFNFQQRVKDNMKFFRRVEDIKADAEYALAKANKIMGVREEKEIIGEHKEKAGEIDEEIRRLEEQLKESD